MITLKSRGDFKKTENFFKRVGKGDYLKGLKLFGDEGVKALQEATPKDTGKTANSWFYRIIKNKTGIHLVWSNSNINNGASVALLIQYGHGTPSGYYIEGIDYINPALKPLFEKIARNVWLEVTNNAYRY